MISVKTQPYLDDIVHVFQGALLDTQTVSSKYGCVLRDKICLCHAIVTQQDVTCKGGEFKF